MIMVRILPLLLVIMIMIPVVSRKISTARTTMVIEPMAGVNQSKRLNSEGFKKLLQTVAAGWNEGNAYKAADCYTEDAIYSAPPQPNYRKGKRTLYEFFGGDKGRESPMRMLWHHLAFDEESQVGFGEYTFKYKEYQAHGVVTVKVRDGKISNWREYEVESSLSWESFIGENRF
jgi:hypothetical protein